MATPPSELRQLQTLFYQAIAPQPKASNGATPSNQASSNQDAIAQLAAQIRIQDKLSFEQGLAAYQGSVMGKLTRALEEIYPVCCCLVGAEFFAAMSRVYVRKYSSHSPDLGDYGEQLPSFLEQFEPAAALPYLPDVARLEWSWHRVFNAMDRPGLDFPALANIPPEQWEQIRFELPHNSILLASPYPIHRIWQVNQPGYVGSAAVNLEQGGAQLLIWRDRLETRIDLPSEADWQLLQAFAAGQSFGEICAQFLNQEPEIDVAAQLPIWVQRGWITGFSIAEMADP